MMQIPRLFAYNLSANFGYKLAKRNVWLIAIKYI